MPVLHAKWRMIPALAGAALLLTTAVPRAAAEDAKAQQESSDKPAEKHHSKAKGALVGGASLDVGSFTAICETAARLSRS